MNKQGAARGLPLIECSITFLSARDSGRTSLLPPGALRGEGYRPHLVIGDPTQRHALISSGNQLVEEYIGVAFHDGPAVPSVGTEMKAELTLMYYPDPMYDRLQPGVTFTVREGACIVGHGTVIAGLFWKL